jgi:hypothetical protein
MKNLRDGIQGSVFPVKLLMAYIVSYCLLPTVAFFADFGNLEGEEESWNSDLEFSLILCIPLLCVILVAVWKFRKMPIFAVIMILIAMCHIGDTLGWYFSDTGFIKNFPPGLELDLSLSGCLIAALVWALPFVITFVVWLFWNRRKPLLNNPSIA